MAHQALFAEVLCDHLRVGGCGWKVRCAHVSMEALIAYVKILSQLGKKRGNKLRVGVVVQVSHKKERSYGAG